VLSALRRQRIPGQKEKRLAEILNAEGTSNTLAMREVFEECRQ